MFKYTLISLFHFPRELCLQLREQTKAAQTLGKKHESAAASTHLLRLFAKWNRKIPATNKNKSFPSSTKKGKKKTNRKGL